MGASPRLDAGGDINPVAGDEPARSGDNHRLRRLAGGRRRKQHAQRIALVEVGEPGYPAAMGKPDFGGAVGQ